MRFSLGILMIAAPLFAQSLPDAAPLLARQTEELERYHSYEFTMEMTTAMNMPGMATPPFTITTVLQAVNPGKSRYESKLAGMGSTVIVSDGENTWTYEALTNQYVKAGTAVAGSTYVSADAQMKGMTENAKVSGSELLDVDGEQRDCWVIESRIDKLEVPGQAASMQDGVFTIWVDKASGMQWKTTMSGKMQVNAATPAMEMKMTTLTHSLKINPDLPDSLFVFTPPAGAKESDSLFPGMPQMASGKPAAASAPAAAKPTAPAEPGEPEAYVPQLAPIERIEPKDPPEVTSQKLQGFVRVLVTIDPTGAVTSAEALTGAQPLRSAATDAIRQWTFRPVIRNGHAVAAFTDAMLSFPADRDFSLADGADFDPKAPDFGKLKDLGFDMEAEVKAQQRLQELEAKFPRSPEQVFADTQQQSRGATDLERLITLPDLAKQALEAGDLAQASSYATELLQMTDKYEVRGKSIYDANIVLGRVALKQGSVSQARQYLLEAGKAPAPAFEFFTPPDFTLAHELLEKGERDAVVEFLTELKGFWKSGSQQLDEMIAAVRSGKTF